MKNVKKKFGDFYVVQHKSDEHELDRDHRERDDCEDAILCGKVDSGRSQTFQTSCIGSHVNSAETRGCSPSVKAIERWKLMFLKPKLYF